MSTAPVSTPMLSARTQDSGSASGGAPMSESVITTEDTPLSESQNYRSEEPNVGTNIMEDVQDEEEITVLHPDHPLMQRFQNKLRDQLTKVTYDSKYDISAKYTLQCHI